MTTPEQPLSIHAVAAEQWRVSDLWIIDGYRVRLFVWTPEEWEALDRKPADAQLHPCGLWMALRLD